MKRIGIFFGMLIMLAFAGRIYAQNEKVDTRVDNMSYWMKMAEKGLVPYTPNIPIPPAVYKGTLIKMSSGKTLTDSPDVPVTNLTNVTESENSVFIDPDNNQYILNSNNSTSWSGGTVGTLYGADYLESANGGTTWGGSVNGAGGANSGDPTTAIDHDGRQYVNFIDNPGGQGIAYSDDAENWITKTIAPNPGSLADKNHMWIDNSTSSAYVGYLYTAWTDFGGTDDTEIKISRSTDRGNTWSTGVNLSSAVNAGSHNQGVNIQTGPNGEVYVVWTIYDSWPSDETALGFTKSTNGGSSYSTASRIISNLKGIRTTGVLKNHRVNSFPSMAVDVSNGPNRGNIYIVWTNIGVPGTNSGTNKSVYLIRSTNGGTTWSTPIRVNQGTFADGKESYCPWISCDPETGTLSVIFYDDRNTASTACEAWVSYSIDAGNTWQDFRVSDVSFTPTPISGLASSYMGDYLGITSKGGRVYPCWTDTRNGLFMTYVSPFVIGLNAAFTASTTTVCTGTPVTFTDQSSGPPTTWTWSFPGGSPSTYVGQNPPAITYNTPGTYDVTLVVTDGTGTDTETKTGFITVKDIFANFTGAPTPVVVGNTVTFTNSSLCSPTTATWSFPGGTPSTYSGLTPPAITYSTIGTYDVTLTVTKGSSTDTKTRTGYIVVTPPEFNMTNGTITTCTGNFYDSGGASGSYANSENYTETFYPSSAGAMVRFVFSSFSTESGYDYLRIYNGTSTAATLIGTYNGTTGPGTVTASNASGALTFNFTSDGSVVSTGWVAAISCQITTVPPVADFSASSLTPAINSTVTFTDLSSNIPTSWLWSFSPGTVTYVGGTSATSQNPQVQFTAVGPYTVSLTATNSYGSDNETKTNYINAVACSPCASTSNNATEEWISNVTFNTINNTSAGSVGYQDFTSLSTPVNLGSTYPLSVTCSQTGSWTEHYWAFMDWNNDCDFTDAGESFDLGQATGPSTLTLNIPIPSGATPGATRMRISLKYSADPTSCETFAYGQVEDYTLMVQSSAPALTVTPSNQNVTGAAGSTTFAVTTASSWTATSNQAWCTVTPSGTGNGTITATYTQNTTSSSRIAQITVTVTGLPPVTVTVTQAAPTLTVTPSSQNVTAASGSTTYSVTSNSYWTASSDQAWCTVTSNGTGSGTITAWYTANTVVASRTANITVTVSGLTPVVVTLVQEGIPPTLSVTPSDQPVSPAAGTTSFTVTSNTDWTVSSNQSWCTVTPSGTGNGTITANYAINNTALSRVANITVTVSGLTPVVVTVTQAAPTLSVTPSNQDVTYPAGSTAFTVTSNSNWTSSSDQGWCTVTSSGSGNGGITVNYMANTTSSSRVANITVTVTGLTPVVVTVTQAGTPVPEFNYTIVNDVQTSDRTLEFDLYLLDTQPASPFELSIIQAGILMNSGIINGGAISVSIVPNSSELVLLQQPTSVLWSTGSTNGCIKVTPKAAPGCGSGTTISTTGHGTRICRIKVANTVPFTSNSQANLTFTFTTSPYPTKVFQYFGTPCISNQITTNSTNCFSLATNPFLNGPPTLSVSPSDQHVSSASGTIPFTVSSNALWTVASNQSWCTATPSGFGNGTITATFTENTDPSPRTASLTVTVTGLTPVIVTVTQDGAPIRTLNLTVFLEGLYIGENTMHPAMDDAGYHWGATVADNLTVELHSGSNYSNVVYTATNVSLSTIGTATFTLPSTYNGSYYVTILNRNHVLTTTSSPVSFNSSIVSYTFDAPGKAYGNNMLLMIDGKYVFYAGDSNQDGLVDGSDLSEIENLAIDAVAGFLPEDINGDGLVDGSDLSIAGNNAQMAIGSITP